MISLDRIRHVSVGTPTSDGAARPSGAECAEPRSKVETVQAGKDWWSPEELSALRDAFAIASRGMTGVERNRLAKILIEMSRMGRIDAGALVGLFKPRLALTE